ncbi:MAG: N-acetyl-gamma-glutamyl-phosphate reductase [Gammaproteobacteria bacterium]|nr:N-acetyl-gamma-glutamyl-phosphate reductase [Gammaproteobacteria bacterium]NNM13159.1 N-acetyl-gamma-glutamyl-phosphate reductase [Gammaproteobacteria bacterium]
MSSHKQYKVAIIGARGYVGNELIKLLDQHPYCNLLAVSSRTAGGKKVQAQIPSFSDPNLTFTALNPAEVGELQADVVFLALPNNVSHTYVEEIRKHSASAVIVDLSFDHRMQCSQIAESLSDTSWSYGLSELNTLQLQQSRSIANPGCYASAAQLALYPLRDHLCGKPSVFGVSGYSGAGSTPSDKNDPNKLKDNLVPYALAGHLHEQEISKHLGRAVNFMPHVAPHFQGLSVTVSAELSSKISSSDLLDLYTQTYQGHELIKVQKEIPFLQDIAKKPGAIIGGFAIDERDGKNVRLVCVLDNLLKGAAIQALQNMNLALGLAPLLAVNTSD